MMFTEYLVLDASERRLPLLLAVLSLRWGCRKEQVLFIHILEVFLIS